LEQRCCIEIPQCNIRGLSSTSVKNASTGASRSKPYREFSANNFNDNVVHVPRVTEFWSKLTDSVFNRRHRQQDFQGPEAEPTLNNAKITTLASKTPHNGAADFL